MSSVCIFKFHNRKTDKVEVILKENQKMVQQVEKYTAQPYAWLHKSEPRNYMFLKPNSCPIF